MKSVRQLAMARQVLPAVRSTDEAAAQALEWHARRKAQRAAAAALARRGPINLVDDAVSDRGPKPRAAERGSDEVLVARAPGRGNPGRAERFFA